MNGDTWPEGYGMHNYEDATILKRLLKNFDISSSTLCSILGISQTQLWKYEKEIRPLPRNYQQKLERFLEQIRRK